MKKLINPLKVFLTVTAVLAFIFMYLQAGASDLDKLPTTQIAINCSIAMAYMILAIIGYKALESLNDN